MEVLYPIHRVHSLVLVLVLVEHKSGGSRSFPGSRRSCTSCISNKKTQALYFLSHSVYMASAAPVTHIWVCSSHMFCCWAQLKREWEHFWINRTRSSLQSKDLHKGRPFFCRLLGKKGIGDPIYYDSDFRMVIKVFRNVSLWRFLVVHDSRSLLVLFLRSGVTGP